MEIPAPVRARVDDYLRAADATVPGFVEGAYFFGSVALDDWRPDSDVDLAVISAVRPDPSELAALHAERLRPHLDVLYLTWDDLTSAPSEVPSGPFAVDGRFYPSGRGPRVPVTWHTIASSGASLRGPAIAEVPVWTSEAVLREWNLDNLSRYWIPRLDRLSRWFSRYVLLSLSDWEVAWTALGVARIHCTLATGSIASKTAAGSYAIETFDPRWHRIVSEALRIRAGTGRRLFMNPMARRSELLGFARTVISDAQSRWGR